MKITRMWWTYQQFGAAGCWTVTGSYFSQVLYRVDTFMLRCPLTLHILTKIPLHQSSAVLCIFVHINVELFNEHPLKYKLGILLGSSQP